ncbi:MAG: polysaccharide deacetylase family protein [Beijerinckiaceae bacterium]|nr:polysaccharide deacetylase family protein [Beijerinckiaceae bacterium]
MIGQIMKVHLILCILTLPLAGGALLASAGAAPGAACPPEALGTGRVLEIGTAGGLQIGLKTYPQSLDLASHEIVLTFDDGPAIDTTPKVLDALAKECVKASFFLVGRNADAHPQLVKRTAAEGHTIAHHTFSHPDETLRGMSGSDARADILRGFEADDKAAYGAAGGAPKVPFFRFPGFADTKELVTWLSSKNIAVFGADFWASDWALMTPEAQLNLVLERLEKEQRGILLFHDTRPQTAAMLPEFLRELKKRDYRIVHIVPGAVPPPLRPAPEGWTSATEKIIAEVFARRNRAEKTQGAAGAPEPVPPQGTLPPKP